MSITFSLRPTRFLFCSNKQLKAQRYLTFNILKVDYFISGEVSKIKILAKRKKMCELCCTVDLHLPTTKLVDIR